MGVRGTVGWRLCWETTSLVPMEPQRHGRCSTALGVGLPCKVVQREPGRVLWDRVSSPRPKAPLGARPRALCVHIPAAPDAGGSVEGTAGAGAQRQMDSVFF